jgi:hypothetical protein
VRGIIAALGWLGLAAGVWAQVREIPHVRPASPPRIDGILDAGEWPAEARGDRFEDDNGGPTTVPIEFWLCSDERFVYVAIRVQADPRTLRAQNYRVNSGLLGDDAATLIIDGTGTGTGSGSGSGADRFSFNAWTGNSIALKGGRAAKREWVGEFDSKGRITESGWEAEARIPWSLISDTSAGTRDLKFRFQVAISRTKRESQFQRLGNNRTLWPIWKGVPVPKIDRRPSILALPYFSFRYDDELGRPLGMDSGVDLKSQSENGITYVAAVNPDFRNVEGEVLDLGFSYFERSTGETRPFFLEGLDDLPENIFSSRRIRAFDGAIKAYGPINSRLRFGVLHTQDFGDQGVTALRLSGSTPRQFGYNFEFVQNDQPGLDNTAARLGLSQRVGGWNARFNSSMTYDQVEGSGSRWEASLSRFTNRGFTMMNYSETSDSYFTRLNFQRGTGNKGFMYNQSIFSRSKAGWIRSASTNFGWSESTRLNGDPYSRNRYLGGELEIANTLSLEANASAGSFLGNKDHAWDAGIGFFPNDPNRSIRAGYSEGRVGSEDFSSWSIDAFYRPTIFWRLSAGYSEFERGGLEKQAVVSASYDLDIYNTIAARAVLRGDEWSWYASYGQAGKRGAEYFLIVGDPNSEKFRPTVALKILVPVEIGF